MKVVVLFSRPPQNVKLGSFHVVVVQQPNERVELLFC